MTTPHAATSAGAADLVCLAAAPTFATMALLAAALHNGPQDMFCSTAHAASPLGGMAWMYLLMSAFHSAPWLKLISNRRGAADRMVAGSRHTCNSHHPGSAR